MIHLLRGGSRANIDLNCKGSAELRRKVPHREAGEAALIGNVLHDAFEVILKEGLSAQDMLGVTFRNRVITQAQVDDILKPSIDYFETHITGDFEVEVFAQVDEDTGGTSDVVSVEGRTLHILDWKTGRGFVAVENNAALQFYAWMILETRDLWDDIDTVTMHIVQPSVNHMAAWSVPVAQIVAFKTQYSKPSNELTAGSWCKWCDAAPLCPVKIADAKSAWTPLADELADAMDLAAEMKDWVAMVEDMTLASLRAGQTVEGWKEVDKRATTKWALDGPSVIAYLTGAGVDLEIAAPRVPMSVAQARKILVEVKPECVSVSSSGTTLAPATDKRPAKIVDISTLVLNKGD